jgi:hypothetical protein
MVEKPEDIVWHYFNKHQYCETMCFNWLIYAVLLIAECPESRGQQCIFTFYNRKRRNVKVPYIKRDLPRNYNQISKGCDESEGDRVQGAEEDIWTGEGWGDGRVKKTA